MSIVQSIKHGQVGTPEVVNLLNALGQLALVVGKAGNGIACVACGGPDGDGHDVFIYGEANAAAATEMALRTARWEIQDGDGNIQTWYNGIGTITPDEVCTDEQIGVPVVVDGNTVQFVDGVCEVSYYLDTDKGSTKTYADADYVTLTMAVGNVAGVVVDVSAAEHRLTAEAHALLIATPKTAGPSAARANTAGAGSFHRQVVLQLQDSLGQILTWTGTKTVTLTPTENCSDAQIAIPVVTGGNTVTLTNGVGHYEFTYDTDEGATKVYTTGDYVTLTPAMANIGGETVTVTDAIVVDTFVA